MEDLEITRASENMYTVKVLASVDTGHTTAKLERWVLAILLCSPRLQVGEQLGTNPRIKLRNPPDAWSLIKWTLQETGVVTGVSQNGGTTWCLRQRMEFIGTQRAARLEHSLGEDQDHSKWRRDWW
ncbi:hypothetical protein V7S43_009403 [Phytophthora oleae]|uniref:Uncharacterized protein n=1 Tax=Phytophthora oleae TaxID=2107226 RepID=A0ABD3FII3_9STRA